MSWIFAALLAPALSTLGSYTDKYLLVHHRQTGGLGSVLIFSSLFGALVLPAALFFGAEVDSVSTSEIALLIANGCLTVITLATYLYAIRDSDVISVVPILQTVPIFAFILGFLVLGETLHIQEIIGSGIVIVSAMLLSVEIEEDARVRFKARSFFLAIFSAFLLAVTGTTFKLIASDTGYWTAQFWEYIGVSIMGLLMFVVVATYRRSFQKILRQRRFDVIGLNFITEALTVSADLLLNFAALLAPIALVYTVNSFQPAFLLMFAFMGLLVAPHLIYKLGFLRKHLLIKTLAIAVMIVGAIIIHLA